MPAKLVSASDKTLKIEVEISISNSMLESEENIQRSLNDCGILATEIILQNFDSDGSPIKIGKEKYTSKGQVSKNYQSPYGELNIPRHVYQSSSGGKTFCPLDADARIITYSTPKFAKQVSSKYSGSASPEVQKDLKDNHGRHISREYIRKISESVSDIFNKKEKYWQYVPVVAEGEVSSVGIGLDGTCMYIGEDGWRETMVGTISLYNQDGERLHTQYTAAPPQYGKDEFREKFNIEILKVKKLYPDAIYTGIADGAKDNWSFLEQYTEKQILDFYHASEYISDVSKVICNKKEKQQAWFVSSCHNLKHEKGGGAGLLKEMRGYLDKKYSKTKNEKLSKSITYFENHLHQMNYSDALEENIPIGSGVTESACKVIVKQRLCSSGMKWKDKGARTVLCLRSINKSGDKWAQMWNKLSRYGI